MSDAMSHTSWPFPASTTTPRMHHSALPSAFVSSPPPHHHHHQSTTPFINSHTHVQQFSGQGLDTALDNTDWSPAQFPSILSNYSCSEQDLDLQLSSPHQFDGSGLNSVYSESFQPEVFHYPDPLQSNIYSQNTHTSTDLSQWGALEPTLPQLQCSSLGYTSRDTSWTSTDYNFTQNTDNYFQFYPNSYQENQNFLSPSTPGPSPHYPPFVTSPSTDNNNNTERMGFQTFVESPLFTVTSEVQNSPNDLTLVQEQTKPKRAPRGRGGGRQRKSRADKNKNKDTPVPAIVPVAAVMPVLMLDEKELSIQGAQSETFYCSLMRVTDRGRYRPPPILCPTRAGAGLHCSIYSTEKSQSNPASLGTLASEMIPPKINIGRSFQAEITPLRNRRHANSDSHNALLLWRPLKDLELSVNQQRVEALLKLARSSAVPGGRANPEDVLRLLSENRGDFLLTLEKLLTLPKSTNKKQVQAPPSQSKVLQEKIKTGLKQKAMGAPPQQQQQQQQDEQTPITSSKSKQKTSKDVHFCVLPDKYEPLIEEPDDVDSEERRRRKEEKKRKKKIKYKKYKKNMGKAFRFSWRCLLAGLQSMVPVCSGPMGAASIVTAVHTGRTV